jgi:thiamine pyrophosphokinase
MSICYLVGAGDFNENIELYEDDLLIAVDGGFDSLMKAGYTPDVLIGDLDSVTMEIPESVKVLKYHKEKDETDMFLAYRIGVRCGYTDFVILGGTGGRLDHTYANISILLYAKEHGHNITMIDEKSMIICIKNESVRLSGNPGSYLSVFAIGGKAYGVSIKGAKYEVEDENLSPAFPLGVSNEFTDTDAFISVEDGALIIIAE